MIKVTVWNEMWHERREEDVRNRYPDGIHEAIAAPLRRDGRFDVRCATLEEDDAGLPDKLLDDTDVLLWWGHKAHDEVPDDVARRVQSRVLEGMGFIALHSAHFSKPFKLLMGTTCALKWRNTGEKERVWNLDPGHPIAEGIGDYFEIEKSEMYGERFDVPEPERTVFISWFQGGEVFRSGCTWTRGHGRVFYFSPGDQAFPIYHQEQVGQIIVNSTVWAAPRVKIPFSCPSVLPLEAI